MIMVHGGKVWVGDGKPLAEALLVKDGVFHAVGSKTYVESKINQGDKVEYIDVQGSLVIPGISDAHQHLTAYCKQGLYLDLTEVKSIDEMLEQIRRYAENMQQYDWLRVIGYNETLWDDPVFPTIEMLDAVSCGKSLLASRYCGHIHVANSLAIKNAGLWDSADESIVRDTGGKPTGKITETGAGPILDMITAEHETPEKLRALALESCRAMAALGITAIHVCDAPLYGLAEDIAIFQDLYDNGELPVRIIAYHDKLPNLSFRSGYGNRFISYAGLKIYIDGALGGRTAALREPYNDAPESKGQFIRKDDDLYELIKEAQLRDIQIQIHMIGDAAIDQAIRAAERVVDEIGMPRYPLRFNHVIVSPPDQLEHLLRLGAVLDIQPIQSYTDRFMAPARLGENRMKHTYSFRRLYDSGLLITGSSDSPMEAANPWTGIWAAVCRCDESGNALDGFNQDEVLTLEEALTIFTKNPYKAIGWDGYGVIAEGTKADFVILENNPLDSDVKSLKNVKARRTYLEGVKTFSAD